MRILLAPDSFKGTLSAREVIEIVASELMDRIPQAEIVSQPLSDGGEGFVAACCFTADCERISVPVQDPLGREVNATYARRGDEAIIEMASAAGIELLTQEELAPMDATTYGVGQLIQHAVESGAVRLYVGLGGSATHDAGFGLLRALGAQFYRDNQEIQFFRQVEKIESIDLGKLNQIIDNVEVICASDVLNPLLGEEGAAHVYATQKGASPDEVKWLDRLTASFAGTIETYLGKSAKDQPGAGAAGGTAFALLACLNAVMRPGFEIVAGLTDLDSKIHKADYVVTGEGYLDHQSRFGKAPLRLAGMAEKHGKHSVGIFGGTEGDFTEFDKVYSLSDIAGSREMAIKHAEEYLRKAAVQLAESINQA